MKHELKYQNTNAWLAPIREQDSEFAEGLQRIHDAICMADDISDRQIHPENTAKAVWLALIGMDYLIARPSYWPRIKKALMEILESEKENLSFIPSKLDIEEELRICLTKASLIEFYFQALCCFYPDIETKENCDWLNSFKSYCLILDDCEDILSGTFEDLRNCRRNYIVLKYFGSEAYFNWKEKKQFFIDKAAEVKDEMSLEPPLDPRLNFFIGESDGNESAE